jgi:phosphate-selective porin OprO/OprP
MRLHKTGLIALAWGGIFAAAGPGVSAGTVEERLQAMERRMMEMEGRLERSESENARLRKALVQREAQGAAPNAVEERKAAGEAVAGLNAKVATLEKKLEQDRETAAAAAKSAPKIELGANGLSVKSADENYQLAVRGYAQADGNVYMDDSSGDKIADNFSVRRARLIFEGSLYKAVDFRFAPDFAQGNVRLFDASVDLHHFPYASLMAGKFRSPINGLERQQGAPNLALVERALTSNLTPTRDIGVMLHGALPYPGYQVQYAQPPRFREFFEYQVGVFDGARDGANLDSEKDDNKEFAGRAFSHPFLHSGVKPLQGLGLGIAGSWGQPRDNALNSLKTAGQQNFLSYKTGVASSGNAYRITPGAYWHYGPFGLLAEYVISSQRLKSGLDTARQDNLAWQVQASYVLTGEDNSFQGIKPAPPFDPHAGQWGAWQIAGRWGELEVDKDTFKFKGAFADSANSARKATEWALGLNWHLNANIKLMSDYAQTWFNGGAARGKDRPTEKAFQTRFQYQF